ncbi:capsular polysaccharide export protein, LipB/KpsS family [Rhizorhapis suberifaciens]|uniref:Capsular polysaccharide export protein n=1 Tax=Rhizorhapis suberifaciens TaxID=13656 RepID=A0A840HR98_9SPHN|nr:hypothetical protein [Rhizorhapis suberifaciens]MBB4640086.1 capsular polysaccharide export protein [Rhizorhapis suberifaciens]
MEDAERARRLVVEHGLLKYNLPDITDSAAQYRIKTRRRVLVIGQVDNDAAVRMGNPGKWRMVDIVRLAKLENPDAEILYRPHPEVYRGYQRTKFQRKLVENIATIVSPEGSLVELLNTTDQVYTLSSLSGLEALIRGVKVTTLGTPFYAGWGATDDRAAQPKGRTLTPTEIFAAVYLLYPKYMVNLPNIADALESTALKIRGDQILLTLSECRKTAQQEGRVRQQLAGSRHWPAILLHNVDDPEARNTAEEDCAPRFPAKDIMISSRDPFLQEIIIALMYGWISNNPVKYKLIVQASAFMDADQYFKLLNSLLLIDGSLAAKQVMANHLRQYPEFGDATEFLRRVGLSLVREGTQKRWEIISGQNSDNDILNIEPADLNDDQKAILYEVMQANFSNRNYVIAHRNCIQLLLLGYRSEDIMSRLMAIASMNFNFISLNALANIMLYASSSKNMLRALAVVCEQFPRASPVDFACWQAALVGARPAAASALLVPKHQPENAEEIERLSVLVAQHVYLNGEISVSTIQALIALEDFSTAIEKSEILIQKSPRDPAVLVVHSQALAAGGKIAKAFQFMSSVFPAFVHSPLVYREMLRLCILRGDYDFARQILTSAERNHVPVGEMLTRKTYFGMREPGKALATFREIELVETFRQHFSEKYYSDDIEKFDGSSIFLLPLYGPGDEIRFASIYSDIIRTVKQTELFIGCEPRLLTLFQRSFPEARMVAVERKSRKADYFDPNLYNLTRNPFLRGILDNRAVHIIEGVDATAAVTDALAEFRSSYDAFSGQPYLLADKQLAEGHKCRLPEGKLRVGISWRSSLNTFSRNEHYLSVQELLPLFSIENVQFVNLQYDECRQELDFVNSHFPGRLFDPEWIDQYNDLDSVAALISGLDLVITSATTVVELAGALGVPTWLMSNSSELHWRKLESTMSDVWHNSVTHVEGRILQDKQSLVVALVQKMNEWIVQHLHEEADHWMAASR